MNQKAIIGIAAAAIAIAVGAISLSNYINTPAEIPHDNQSVSASVNGSKIQVVAAENFWGNLVSQLGGKNVEVTSMLTDPNADPHEYETNTADARAISDANFVIVNGAGYDNWAVKLIGAGSHPTQKVLNIGDMLGKKQGDNPHFWYSPDYVNRTANLMYFDLVSIDPANAAYYKQQYSILNQSLGAEGEKIAKIKMQFAGTDVAATEDIFVYLSNAMGLDLVSPPEFMGAVAEGNDPTVRSVTEFQQLIQNKNVTMLVYNTQTVTPLTDNIKSLAQKNGIPIVGISETIPPANLSYQHWMNGQIESIQKALEDKRQ